MKQRMWSDGIIRCGNVLGVLSEKHSLFQNPCSCMTLVWTSSSIATTWNGSASSNEPQPGISLPNLTRKFGDGPIITGMWSVRKPFTKWIMRSFRRYGNGQKGGTHTSPTPGSGRNTSNLMGGRTGCSQEKFLDARVHFNRFACSRQIASLLKGTSRFAVKPIPTTLNGKCTLKNGLT